MLNSCLPLPPLFSGQQRSAGTGRERKASHHSCSSFQLEIGVAGREGAGKRWKRREIGAGTFIIGPQSTGVWGLGNLVTEWQELVPFPLFPYTCVSYVCPQEMESLSDYILFLHSLFFSLTSVSLSLFGILPTLSKYVANLSFHTQTFTDLSPFFHTLC